MSERHEIRAILDSTMTQHEKVMAVAAVIAERDQELLDRLAD